MSAALNSLPWFAVRTIFRHEATGNTAVFEEKITLYRAADAEGATERARQDAASYVRMNPGFVQIQRYAVFALGHEQDDLDGSEVWSNLSQGVADPDQFFRDRYENFAIECGVCETTCVKRRRAES